ncbi:MAG: hypothetical protein Q7S87_10165 [Agitococcus sp.]|nr:hypothetical protein [Agitococcus sp.]MDO9179308.1 hypothetical protein [Agitococcus sp.]
MDAMRTRVDQFVRIGDTPPEITDTHLEEIAQVRSWSAEHLASARQALQKDQLDWDKMLEDVGELEDFMAGFNYWPDAFEFILDASCEWAYIINLDTEKLEMYTHHYSAPGHESTSYPKRKPVGRYSGLQVVDEGESPSRGATLLSEIPLQDLKDLPMYALISYADRIHRQH